MSVFGVDEAGKGPVLGSMFAAAVRVPSVDVLPDGIRDSKRLTPSRREELATALRADDRVTIGVAEVAPARIDDPETDMNALTVAAHADAIRQVATDGLCGIADAADVNESRFARRVASRVDVDIELDAEHGADDTRPVVSAASVVAKVERDAHVDRLAAEYGEVGSGYPSDPTTRTFLERYIAETGELPPCARASWQTCRDLLATTAQSGLDEF